MKQNRETILEIAKAIMRESPGTTPQKALRHARDIYRNRGKFKVAAEEKATSEEKTPWKQLPKYVKETIRKQKRAEAEREKDGRSLPTTHFVSGGKVSPSELTTPWRGTACFARGPSSWVFKRDRVAVER